MKNDIEKGALIAEYHPAKLKIFAIFAALGIAAFITYQILSPSLINDDYRRYLFIGCVITGITPWVFWGSYFRQKFKISAYHNGIDISYLGFYTWDEVVLLDQEKRIIVCVPVKGELIHKDKVKTPEHVDFFLTRLEDKPSIWGHYGLRIYIPALLTNMSRTEFLKHVSYRKQAKQQSVTRTPPVLPEISKQQWKIWFFGENPTPLKAVWNIVLLAFIISGSYLLIAGDFITFKSSLFTIIKPVCIFLGALLTYLIIKNRGKNPQLADASRKKVFLYTVGGIILYPFMIYAIIGIPLLTSYHYLTAHDYTAAVDYVQKSRFSVTKFCGYKHELNTETFDLPILKKICITDEFYKHMPEEGYLVLKGGESAVGRSVEQIIAPDNTLNMAIPSSDRAQIKAMWKEYQ